MIHIVCYFRELQGSGVFSSVAGLCLVCLPSGKLEMYAAAVHGADEMD